MLKIFNATSLGQQHSICAKRLLPVAPRATSPQQHKLYNRSSRLSVDANIGLETLEHRLQSQLVLSESLFQKIKGITQLINLLISTL